MDNPYDRLIYTALPRPESQPGHLASIARLFGLKSSPLQKARILELGCGTGGNLIPLAELWPESNFLGIDLSVKQIDLGKKIISDLKLKNIELRQQSILDFPANTAVFDYIICHGVFSWVDKSVQDKILEIFSRQLSTEGLGYISYNTLPGWKSKGALREMMQYHTAGINDPEEKAEQARTFIKFLADSQTDLTDPYSINLQLSYEELKSVPPHYLFHEYLEEQNQAFYFYEFVRRLEAANLAYLADAQFSLMGAADLSAETQVSLNKTEDRFRYEQYLDFIRNRKLRESIVCQPQRKITYPAVKTGLNEFYLAADFISKKEQILPGGRKLYNFVTSKGGQINTENPLTAAALQILQQNWPAQIKYAELIKQASDQIKLDINNAEELVLQSSFEEEIFLFYSANLVELSLIDFNASPDYSGKPQASVSARYQSLREERITSLRHKAVQLESIVRQILFFLDGSRDSAAIQKELNTLCERGELKLEFENGKLSAAELQDFLKTIVERSLKLLARHSFFIKPESVLL